MRHAFAIVAVTALVVLAAGCGGSSNSASQTTSSGGSGSSQSSSSSSNSSSSSSSSAASSSSSFSSAKNCTQLVSLGSKVSQALAAQGMSGTTNLQADSNIIKQAASAAPAAIQSDIKTLAGAFSAYAAALKKAGFKPGSTPTAAQYAALGAALSSLDEPKLKAAEQHLDTWVHHNCGASK